MARVDDVRGWLRAVGREAQTPLDAQERRQLAEVLNGPLMRPVVAALSDRLEALKDRAMSLELAKPDEVMVLQGLQAESRGIIVVLELMWEMANVEA